MLFSAWLLGDGGRSVDLGNSISGDFVAIPVHGCVMAVFLIACSCMQTSSLNVNVVVAGRRHQSLIIAPPCKVVK